MSTLKHQLEVLKQSADVLEEKDIDLRDEIKEVRKRQDGLERQLVEVYARSVELAGCDCYVLGFRLCKHAKVEVGAQFSLPEGMRAVVTTILGKNLAECDVYEFRHEEWVAVGTEVYRCDESGIK